MEFLGLSGILVAFVAALCFFLLLILTFAWWVSPIQTHKKLKRCGFGGPTPSFPLGNIKEMKRKNSNIHSSVASCSHTHDIHSYVSPYFSCWQKSHGKPSIENIIKYPCILNEHLTNIKTHLVKNWRYICLLSTYFEVLAKKCNLLLFS